jgi:succinate dehydrogenase / fumarate reductase membrane anchor subunit
MSRLVKWNKGGLKTPMARARGLGSAKSGLDHWLMQRITAVGNLVLGLWLLWSLVCNGAMTYTAAILWVSEPITAILLILFVISSFYHAVLGSQVVIEDYVHHEGFKLFKLLGQRLVFFAMGVACIFSVLQIAL